MVLEKSFLLCYNGDSKNPPRAELVARLRWEVWYAIWGLTTVLTIYRLGLRGNYGLCGTKKHGFRTKKHRKALKKRQKTVIAFFGTRMSQVQILSFRPHENNPNILLLGESFGLFVYLSIPTLIARNENSRYHGLLTLVSALALLKNTQIYDII